MTSTQKTARIRRDRRLSIGGVERGPLAHQLFKFPAKFHPPVARKLVETFSKPGDVILDPFCGSGTLLLEAALVDRQAIGIDVDPLAVFVSRVKCSRVRPNKLRESYALLALELKALRRHACEYRRRQHQDIRKSAMDAALRDESLWIPPIPNMSHWFRRYVVVDLARLLRVIETTHMPTSHREIFLLCFAYIIRASSNADPVPVSGLEVTSHMLAREKEGRIIDPYTLFDKAAEKAIASFEELWTRIGSAPKVRVVRGSALNLGASVPTRVDAVITSPPYHSAVDYYRRHTLEMYWLRLVDSHCSRLALRRHYIGRASVRKGDPLVKAPLPKSALVAWWAREMGKDTRRGIAFRHYVQAMRGCFAELASVMKKDAAVVVVVGRSQWNGYRIRTDRLFEAVAGSAFRLEEVLWYPVKNRYMSYSRQNGASIDREIVLVLRRNGRTAVERYAKRKVIPRPQDTRAFRSGRREIVRV